jgi:HEAT repeat protein
MLPSLVLALAQDDPQDDCRDLLNEAVQLYKQAIETERTRDALNAFDKALRAKPDREVVVAWIKRTGEDIIRAMLNSDPAQQELARRLIRLVRPAEADPAKIKDLIQDLGHNFSGSHTVARFQLLVYGPLAMPQLLPALNDSNSDIVRSRVMAVIKRMGPEAAPFLIQSLESDRDSFKLLREGCCEILGEIADPRALPALRRRLLDPAEHPEVKRNARTALRRLAGRT